MRRVDSAGVFSSPNEPPTAVATTRMVEGSRPVRDRRPSRKALTMDNGTDPLYLIEEETPTERARKRARNSRNQSSISSSPNSTPSLSSMASSSSNGKRKPAGSHKPRSTLGRPALSDEKPDIKLEVKKQIRRARRKENNAAMRYDTLVDRLLRTPNVGQLTSNDLSRMFQVRDPTTWTTLQKDDLNHLGLRYNAFPEHQMALITSVCVPSSGTSSERS